MLRSSLRLRKKWLLSTIMTVLLLEKHFLTEERWCDWPTDWNTYGELHTHTKTFSITNRLCLTVCTAVYNTRISRLLLIWGWRATSVLSPSSTLAAAAALEASLGCAGLTQLMWLSAPLVAVSWLVGCLEHISGRDVSAWQSRHSKLTENWVWVSINGCAAWLAGWLADGPADSRTFLPGWRRCSTSLLFCCVFGKHDAWESRYLNVTLVYCFIQKDLLVLGLGVYKKN